MSEADDGLREMAANRGCRLARSRRRKPGGDYGRYGLEDAGTGREVFGFGKDGLTASAEEIEAFLRGGAASRWKSSLGKAGRATKSTKATKAKKATKAAEAAERDKAAKANKDKPAPPRRKASEAPPERDEPKPPVIREARPGDAEAIAMLVVELGYQVGAGDIRRRIARLRKAGEPALVADRAGIVGCLTWHVTPVLHRPRPVGRLTMMVVAEAARGAGVGTALLAAAEARLRERGCGLVEVTSNIKRLRAHHFYGKHGFERTSYRFVKSLDE